MTRRLMRAAVAIRVLTLALAGWSAAPAALAQPAEPRNISLLKDEIREYVASGEYQRGIAAVATEAESWIQQRANQEAPAAASGAAPVRLAVVFDLDETLIDNAGQILNQDFGYVPGVWADWVDKAQAPAVEPVRRVYETAQRLGLAVIFLSGRRERGRDATERNLRSIGCGRYDMLVLTPDDWKGPSGAFKSAARRRLAAQGFVLVANLGDQASDFEGGGAERDFKLPNPFYLSR